MLADHTEQSGLILAVDDRHLATEEHDPSTSRRANPVQINPSHNAQHTTHTVPPANIDPQVLESDVQPHSASRWTSDPNRARLRRQMGIGADLDGNPQEQQSRDLCREVSWNRFQQNVDRARE